MQIKLTAQERNDEMAIIMVDCLQESRAEVLGRIDAELEMIGDAFLVTLKAWSTELGPPVRFVFEEVARAPRD